MVLTAEQIQKLDHFYYDDFDFAEPWELADIYTPVSQGCASRALEADYLEFVRLYSCSGFTIKNYEDYLDLIKTRTTNEVNLYDLAGSTCSKYAQAPPQPIEHLLLSSNGVRAAARHIEGAEKTTFLATSEARLLEMLDTSSSAELLLYKLEDKLEDVHRAMEDPSKVDILDCGDGMIKVSYDEDDIASCED